MFGFTWTHLYMCLPCKSHVCPSVFIFWFSSIFTSKTGIDLYGASNRKALNHRRHKPVRLPTGFQRGHSRHQLNLAFFFFGVNSPVCSGKGKSASNMHASRFTKAFLPYLLTVKADGVQAHQIEQSFKGRNLLRLCVTDSCRVSFHEAAKERFHRQNLPLIFPEIITWLENRLTLQVRKNLKVYNIHTNL